MPKRQVDATANVTAKRRFKPLTLFRNCDHGDIYDVVRPYALAERKWLRLTGLQVGDRVCLVSIPFKDKSIRHICPDVGEEDALLQEMQGQTYTVTGIPAEDGADNMPAGLCVNDTWVPFYCLIKVE